MFSAVVSLAGCAMLMTGVAAQSDTTPVTGILGNATVINDNPAGVAYVASLSPGGQNHGVVGSVLALTSSDNKGVNFQVSLSGLPAEGGPFIYHIHNDPVSADGNCTSAGSHVDPFQRGEDPTCDSALPETCQVGDLSGKYGKIQNETFAANYIDVYTSTTPGNGAFVGNRSFVVHFANKTRIACANFVSYTNATSSGNSTGSSNSTSASGTSSGSSTSASVTSTSKASGTSGTAGASESGTAAPSTGAGTQLITNFGLILLLGCFAVLL